MAGAFTRASAPILGVSPGDRRILRGGIPWMTLPRGSRVRDLLQAVRFLLVVASEVPELSSSTSHCQASRHGRPGFKEQTDQGES